MSRTNSASRRWRVCRANSLFTGSRSRIAGVSTDDCRYALDVTISRTRCFTSHLAWQLAREPVEQFRVRRLFALRAGFFERTGDAVAEEQLATAVRGDAGGQRVLGRDGPLREVEPVVAPVPGRERRQRRQEPRRVRLHHRAGFVHASCRAAGRAPSAADRSCVMSTRGNAFSKSVFAFVGGGDRVASAFRSGRVVSGERGEARRPPRACACRPASRESPSRRREPRRSPAPSSRASGSATSRRPSNASRAFDELLRGGFEFRLRGGHRVGQRASVRLLVRASIGTGSARPAAADRRLLHVREERRQRVEVRRACTGRTCGRGTRRT